MITYLFDLLLYCTIELGLYSQKRIYLSRYFSDLNIPVWLITLSGCMRVWFVYFAVFNNVISQIYNGSCLLHETRWCSCFWRHPEKYQIKTIIHKTYISD